MKTTYFFLRCFSRALFLLVLFTSSAKSQNLQIILDPVNAYQRGSLFNLSLLNNSPYSGQVRLMASLSNRQGKVLMRQELVQEVQSRQMKGVRGEAVKAKTVFVDNDFSQLYFEEDPLPPLNYILCVSARMIGDQNLASEECTEFLASDFVNLSAIYPANESEVYESRPLFSWLNASVSPVVDFNYDFKLAQVRDGQHPGEAIRRNTFLVNQSNVRQSNLVYPSDAIPLENGREYAWQLTTKYKDEPLFKSEIWSFVYKDQDSIINIPRNLSYVDVDELKEGVTLYAVGEFKFRMEVDQSSEVETHIYKLKKAKNKEIRLKNGRFELTAGINMLKLDLKEQVFLKHLKKYQINIKNKTSAKQYSFYIKYINPDYID